MTTQMEKNDPICVVSVCKDCREAVIFKYVKGDWTTSTGNPVMVTSGGPQNWGKPNIEWCSCGSDEPRHLCRVTNEELPGLEDKCEKCEFRFACASSRIDIVFEGAK